MQDSSLPCASERPYDIPCLCLAFLFLSLELSANTVLTWVPAALVLVLEPGRQAGRLGRIDLSYVPGPAPLLLVFPELAEGL